MRALKNVTKGMIRNVHEIILTFFFSMGKAMKTLIIAKYTIIEGIYNKVIHMTLILGVLGISLSVFISSIVVTEHNIIIASLLSAFGRLSAVLLLVLLSITSIMREQQDKTLELILSLPLNRSIYFMGKTLGFFFFSFMVCLVWAVLVSFYVPFFNALNWGIGLFYEATLMVLLGVLVASTFKNVVPAVLVAILFYVTARSMNALELIATNPLVTADSATLSLMRESLRIINLLLPDLDRFADASKLFSLDDLSNHLYFLLQALVYGYLISMVCLFDFYRKNL